MAGLYPVEMLSIRYGKSQDAVRMALWANGLMTDLDDRVDADAFEKKDKAVLKTIEENEKNRLAEKLALYGKDWDAEKAKMVAAHNESIPQVNSPEEWADEARKSIAAHNAGTSQSSEGE